MTTHFAIMRRDLSCSAAPISNIQVLQGVMDACKRPLLQDVLYSQYIKRAFGMNVNMKKGNVDVESDPAGEEESMYNTFA